MTRYWTRGQTTHFITLKVFQPFFPKTNYSPSSQRAAQRKCGFSGMGWKEHLLPIPHSAVCLPAPIRERATTSLPSQVALSHWDASGIRLNKQQWLCGVLCSLSCQKTWIMCEVTARGTPTLPLGTTQVFLQLHQQLLAQWRLVRHLHAPVNRASICF